LNLNKNNDEFTTPAKQLVGQKGAFHTKDTPRTGKRRGQARTSEDKKERKGKLKYRWKDERYWTQISPPTCR